MAEEIFDVVNEQDEVIDQRPFEEILAEHREAGDIVNFLSPR